MRRGALPALWMAPLLAALASAACRRSDPLTEGAAAGAATETSAAGPAAFAEQRTERERMVRTQIAARDVRDERVLAAMRKVPRHLFVLDALRDRAYSDTPLPIAGGQTISQPYIVAFMSEAAQITPGERCLEIGTGSGYQAAVLAELCEETYSIEYLPEVASFGRRNLERLGYLERKVFLRVGDGYAGWPEHAPFDAILVTAAPERVPEPLLDQLAPSGRLVIPVGASRSQMLEVWTRVAPGKGPEAFDRKKLAAVSFVPFLGEH